MSPTSLPLVFEAPRRGKPPKHWLDLAPEERVEATEKLGLPRFRADQISRHVFDRLEVDAANFTDLPAAIRTDLGEQLFPNLLEQVTRRTTDDGSTVKTLWKLHDGSLLVAMPVGWAILHLTVGG